MKRDEILVVMLHRYHEARDPAFGRDGLPSSGDGYPHMPSTWNHSYRELERCLVALREAKPMAYAHVVARHLDRTEKVKLLRFVKGAPVLPERCEVAAGTVSVGERFATVRVWVWPEWVDESLVAAGLEWLSGEYRGEPFLPEEFLAVA